MGLLGDEVLLLEGESSTDSTGLLVSEVKGDVYLSEGHFGQVDHDSHLEFL